MADVVVRRYEPDVGVDSRGFGIVVPRPEMSEPSQSIVVFAQDMDDAVAQAASYAESEDAVLLAPACASLDQYENYAARGEAFCSAARALQR